MSTDQPTDYDYIRDRLDDQTNWYEEKANAAKRNFHRLNVVIMVASASIPLLGVFGDHTPRELDSILGGIAALSSGLLSLYSWQHLWTKYRGAAETLTQEKMLFLSRAGPYVGGSIDLLVERCEAVMANERENWARAMQNANTREARKKAIAAARHATKKQKR